MDPLMNDTKWAEVRAAMLEIEPSPRWRTKDVENGYVSGWDREWYYHFRDGGYRTIEWVEIEFEDELHTDVALAALRAVHVPGEIIEGAVRVFGHATSGSPVDWL